MINRRIFYLIVILLEFYKDNFDVINIVFNFYLVSVLIVFYSLKFDCNYYVWFFMKLK